MEAAAGAEGSPPSPQPYPALPSPGGGDQQAQGRPAGTDANRHLPAISGATLAQLHSGGPLEMIPSQVGSFCTLKIPVHRGWHRALGRHLTRCE